MQAVTTAKEIAHKALQHSTFSLVTRRQENRPKPTVIVGETAGRGMASTSLA
jgi:hypothetical protein